MTKPVTHLSAFERLHETLVNAQAFRGLLNERPLEDGKPAWVAVERGAMHAAVNRLRDRVGLPGVDPELVERAESMAAGHVDYTKKYALYCADLVHD